MRFANIELELQPMTGLAVIERTLTPANDGVRPGLQVQIRLCSHRLDDLHDRRKTRGRVPSLRKLRDFDVFRSNPKEHWFAEKFTRLGSVSQLDLDRSSLHLLEKHGIAFLP